MKKRLTLILATALILLLIIYTGYLGQTGGKQVDSQISDNLSIEQKISPPEKKHGIVTEFKKAPGVVSQTHPFVTDTKESPIYLCSYKKGDFELPALCNPDLWANVNKISFNKSAITGKVAGLNAYARFFWTDSAILFCAEVEIDRTVEEITDNDQLWLGSNLEFIICPKWYVTPFMDEFELLFNQTGGCNSLHWTGEKNLKKALSWQADGLEWDLSQKMFLHKDNGITFVGKIPFDCLGTLRPQINDHWGLGLYRKIITKEGDTTFIAWSPTFENPANFHVPSKFGVLIFTE